MDLKTKEGLFSHIYYLFLNQEMKKISVLVSEIGENEVLKKFENTQFNNFDAWTCYRIGEAFYKQNNYKKSILFFEQASSLAPFNLHFVDKYASNLVMIENFDEAIEKFKFIINENNQFVSSYNNLSRLYFEKYLLSHYDGDKNLSNYYCDIALSIDPIYQEAMRNKVDLFLVDNDFNEARLLLIKCMFFVVP